MCGILGQINKSSPIDKNSFSRMLNTLLHRGPDDFSSIFLNQQRVALGHRRLSIIDLSKAGTQPMSNEDGSIWLTFNGEIYNYLTLRRELEKKGHIFKSKTDSETIIHAYEEWGVDCPKWLRGIFAFGIYDCNKKSLFLARDHVGVKPLYYKDSESFIFASQPRAILESQDFRISMDLEAFSLYLAYGNVPGDKSIYKGINKLLPGHWLLFKDGKTTIKQYWKLKYNPIIQDKVTATEAVQSKVEESINLQTISDVPVGTLLSGGVDSTIITSVLASKAGEIPSFTMGFAEEESDERQYARLVANTYKTQHREGLLTHSDSFGLMSDIVEAYDEPFHLNGLFPFYAVSKLVKSNGIKVALGGDGADEIFAGYLWYDRFQKHCNIGERSFLQSKIYKHFKNVLFKNQDLKPIREFFSYNGFFDPNAQLSLLGYKMKGVDVSNIYDPLLDNWHPNLPPVLAAQLMDFNCFLVDHCLTKVDRASMACGVEVRVPFLDVELVEMIFSIDHDIIYHKGERKALLKQAMKNNLPPNMNSHRKKGFSSPLSQWLHKGFTDAGKSFLIDGSLCANGYLDRSLIKTSYSRLGAGKQFLLISAELWYRRWFENDLHAVNTLHKDTLHKETFEL